MEGILLLFVIVRTLSEHNLIPAECNSKSEEPRVIDPRLSHGEFNYLGNYKNLKKAANGKTGRKTSIPRNYNETFSWRPCILNQWRYIREQLGFYNSTYWSSFQDLIKLHDNPCTNLFRKLDKKCPY